MNKSLGLAFALLSATAACNINDGDRFSLGDCPDGETCSDQTPEGLQFQGASVDGVGGIAKTAVGGTQTIVLIRPDLNGQEQPFPYTVDDDGGAAVHATGHEGAHIQVQGVAPGSNLLRILDPNEGGTLMDRTTLAAARVGELRLASGLFEVVPPDVTTVAFSGSAVTVALRAEHTNERLVDEGLIVDAGDAAFQRSWQNLELRETPVGPLAITATLGGSGEHIVGSTAIVDHLASIEQQLTDFTDPSSLTTEAPLNTSTLLCFSPLTSDGAFVLGAPLRYASSPNATVTDHLATLMPNCTWVEPTSGTSVDVTAFLGETSTTITLAVVPQQGVKYGARATTAGGFAAGERAALLAR